MPVFWSHDPHGRQQQQKGTKNLQKQRPKAANLESKASEAKFFANRGQDRKKSKSSVDASDKKDSPLELKAPVRGNGGAGEGQGHGQGVHLESDKNRRAKVDVVPVSVTADAQEHLGANEQREHLLPQQAKRAAAPALEGSSQHHRRGQYAPEGFSVFFENGCRSSSMMMISGALVALLLVSYRFYKRTQRQRQMAGLSPTSPLDLHSLKAPLSPS